MATMESVRFVVYGDPIAKGSKTPLLIGGKARMMDAAPSRSKDPAKRRAQRERLKAWPKAIVDAARKTLEPEPTVPKFTGPVCVSGRFFMPRPKSRRFDYWHTVKPDLDKLLRMLLDPLVVAGMLRDDCLVVSFNGSEKLYAALGAGLGDPDGPRVEVAVFPLPRTP